MPTRSHSDLYNSLAGIDSRLSDIYPTSDNGKLRQAVDFRNNEETPSLSGRDCGNLAELYRKREHPQPLSSTDYTTIALPLATITGLSTKQRRIKMLSKTQCMTWIGGPPRAPLALARPLLPPRRPPPWPSTCLRISITTWAEPPRDITRKFVTHRPSRIKKTPSGMLIFQNLSCALLHPFDQGVVAFW